MNSKKIVVVNELGVHMRPAGKIVRAASSFKSDIVFRKNGQEVNAKSVLGVLSLAAAQGSEIEVIADGEDEEEALEAIEKLFANRFDEE